MIEFDHRKVGTDCRAWDPLIDEAAPLGAMTAGTLTVLSAHPDDETLGAGGLLATATRAGHQVRVVVATYGEASHPSSVTHTPAQLMKLRRAEVTAAVQCLAGAAELVFLELPDGKLADHEVELTERLRHLLPPEGWVVAPWRLDAHPDHEVLGSVAEQLTRGLPRVRLLEYPIWVWHWGRPDNASWTPNGPDAQALRVLHLDEETAGAKHSALACHHSQVSRLSDEPGDEEILPSTLIAHFHRPAEVFVEMRHRPGAAASHFELLYAGCDDPWNLGRGFYEQRKRELVLASLPRPRFRRVFEPGCATGLLTSHLAQRCEQLIATDTAARAVQLAQERITESHVHITQAEIPADWPDGTFDLIVLSEVAYYCVDLGALRERVERSLTPDGVLLACHWRHPASDHPRSAEEVHAALGESYQLLVSHAEEDFLLQVWSRSGRSVAYETAVLA